MSFTNSQIMSTHNVIEGLSPNPGLMELARLRSQGHFVNPPTSSTPKVEPEKEPEPAEEEEEIPKPVPVKDKTPMPKPLPQPEIDDEPTPRRPTRRPTKRPRERQPPLEPRVPRPGAPRPGVPPQEPEMAPSFTASIDPEGDPLAIHFLDTTSGAQPSFWQWDFGDGTQPSNEPNPVHKYATSGTYKVRVYVTNDAIQAQLGEGATLSASADIPVALAPEMPPIEPEEEPPVICPPGCEPIEQYESIEGYNGGGFWAWLTAWFTGATLLKPKVKPTFTVSKKEGDDFSMYFKDTSTCVVEGDCTLPTKFKWDFGDGSTSTAKNPIHLYTETGTYLVSMTVFDEHLGDYVLPHATAKVPVVVAPEEEIQPEAPPPLVCPPGCRPKKVEGFGIRSRDSVFWLIILILIILVIIAYRNHQ